MSLSELIASQLVIASTADSHRCSRCGRHLDRWYYGFPLPVCAWCVDSQRRTTERTAA